MNLYVITDSRILAPISGIIEQPNDTMAIFGFCSFVKKQKEENNLEPVCFRLKKIGEYNADKAVITNTDTHYLVRGDQAEARYGELLQKAIDEEQGI